MPRLLVVLLVLMLLNGCRETEPPTTSSPPAVQEVLFHTFAGDMPQTVLEAFTRESGITVSYLPFQSPEEAEDNIRAGNRYDVVLIENQLFPALIKEQFLAELDFAQLPNFKNISANFRDLVIDPGNRYSVPASYGTTGLVVRTDLVGDGLKRWADLWKPQYAGKIGLRAQPREIIGMTLTSLGYPFGSENPLELEAVLQRLLALKPSVSCWTSRPTRRSANCCEARLRCSMAIPRITRRRMKKIPRSGMSCRWKEPPCGERVMPSPPTAPGNKQRQD
jgi:spermidine/putrescine transport system substrate-binding protein